MMHQHLSMLATRSSCNFIKKASRPPFIICQLNFSSTSEIHAPKFPAPSYVGQSQPIPKSILPSSSLPSNHRTDDIALQQYETDLANALRPSFESQTPLLLSNLLSNCDALHFWKSIDYWRLAVGENTPVEVEVGKTYNKGSRANMMFGEYLNYLSLCMEQEAIEFEEYKQNPEKHLQQPPTATDQEVAYLAQNELFPQVINDITIPSFTDNEKYNVGEGKLYHTMLWMGPRNTISPLHFDPLDNILMQVVGWKRVLLFPPDIQTDYDDIEGDEFEKIIKRSHAKNDGPTWHYAATDGSQYNTSPVDVENPDIGKFPNFKELAPTPYECILGPGDALYIPKKWWHHVRSLETSVSANVWWR